MLKIDPHVHSIASGHALNTVYELAAEARKRKLTHLGITEHGPSMEGAPHEGYFWVSSVAPRKIGSVSVLYGVEANVVDLNGKIDIGEELLKVQDIVSVGLHRKTSYDGKTIEHNTKALINAMKNKYVKIITHPYRAEFPVDVYAIADAACKYGVLLEINIRVFKNLNSRLLEAYRSLISFIKDRGEKVIVGSMRT
jgi:putative hydrolase